MTKASTQCASSKSSLASAPRVWRFGLVAGLIAATAVATAAVQYSTVRPSAGDTYVYRVINGSNNESGGQLSYRVDSSGADRIVMSVTSDKPGQPVATTEIYTPDGKWLRHPLINRDQPVDYEFSPAYPSYEFPLEPGKQWSSRVDATNPASGVRRSVRVDAKVIGTERIRVPAGEFDTIKIQRTVYAGDSEPNLSKTETTIAETEWFAPALGRSVQFTRRSGYIDAARGPHSRAVPGDWNIYQLVSLPQAR